MISERIVRSFGHGPMSKWVLGELASVHIAPLCKRSRKGPRQDSRRLLYGHIFSAFNLPLRLTLVSSTGVRVLTYPTRNTASRWISCRAFVIHSLRGIPDLSGARMCYCSRRNEKHLDDAFAVNCDLTPVSTSMAAKGLPHEELIGSTHC